MGRHINDNLAPSWNSLLGPQGNPSGVSSGIPMVLTRGPLGAPKGEPVGKSMRDPLGIPIAAPIGVVVETRVGNPLRLSCDSHGDPTRPLSSFSWGNRFRVHLDSDVGPRGAPMVIQSAALRRDWRNSHRALIDFSTGFPMRDPTGPPPQARWDPRGSPPSRFPRGQPERIPIGATWLPNWEPLGGSEDAICSLQRKPLRRPREQPQC